MNARAEIDTERGRITLPGYRYPARKTRVLERTDIVEIVDWFPPAILTTSGEFLFVPRGKLDDVQAYCAAHDVPFTKRYDVWGDLLDPFLDTEFSDQAQQATRQRLRERGGLSDREIDELRARVEAPMLSFTAVTWEWQFYGLFDVLTAMKPRMFLGRKKWMTFYDEAMEIAFRAFA